MGTKLEPGAFDCYDNAKPDEPMFVLLARDRTAAALVALWAAVRSGNRSDFADAIGELDLCRLQYERIDSTAPAKIEEAFMCSSTMRDWRRANPEV